MYLKKIIIGNPLQNFELTKELKAYNEAQTDEELAKLYHNLLDMAERENRGLLRGFIFAMIAFSTGLNINADQMVL